MKKTMINQTHIEGYLYEHALEVKVTGDNSKNPGTTFISGTVSIATDDEMVNIVPVHFTYVTPVTSTGKANATFDTLNNVVNGTFGSVMKNGVENAVKLRIDSAIGLNEFYTDRNGKEELVSAKRNEGGFVHKVDVLEEDEKLRNTFKTDMIINCVTRIEANEDTQTPEKVIVKGAIFNFRKDLLPVEFSATNPNAMNYFESLGATQKEPVFTCVWGRQMSEVIVRKIVTESAFGEDEVREVKNTRKDFVITGASKEPYVWDDESSITAVELNEAIQKREVDLAAMKKRQDEYKASKGAATSKIQPAASTPAAGGFKF